MARTKASAKRRVLKQDPDSVSKDTGVKVSDFQAVKKRRWKPGTVALREIRHYQRNAGTVIPKAPFGRLVREVLQETGTGEQRLSKGALEALQEGGEKYVCQLHQLATVFAIHSKRVTITQKDLTLATAILNGHGTFAEAMSHAN